MNKRKEDQKLIKTALFLLALDAAEHNTDHIRRSFDIDNELYVSCDLKFDFDLKEEETEDD